MTNGHQKSTIVPKDWVLGLRNYSKSTSHNHNVSTEHEYAKIHRCDRIVGDWQTYCSPTSIFHPKTSITCCYPVSPRKHYLRNTSRHQPPQKSNGCKTKFVKTFNVGNFDHFGLVKCDGVYKNKHLQV